MISGTQCTTLPYDTYTGQFVDELRLLVNDISIDVYDIVNRIKSLNELLRKWATDRGYTYKISRVPLLRASLP